LPRAPRCRWRSTAFRRSGCPSRSAAAFYVVSESLANVAKYASASRAQVDLARDDGLLVVEVSDDGVGGADPGEGSGLRGLADRVEALGGHFHVSSERGLGTTVRAELPLH
jgi:signal transduction histidine kinase